MKTTMVVVCMSAIVAGSSRRQLIRSVAAFVPDAQPIAGAGRRRSSSSPLQPERHASTHIHLSAHTHTFRRSLYIQPRKTKEELLRGSHGAIMMAVDDNDSSEEGDGQRSMDSEWDVSGLKAETQRMYDRAIKKTSKSSKRVADARQRAEELMSDPDASMEALEACPNVDALEAELAELQNRLKKLNELDEELKSIKSKNGKRMVLPENVAAIAIDLGVNDEPPKRAPRGPKKKKGPRANEVTPRNPYRKYFTESNIEIRVGKQAPDNDALSLLPEHRDGADWWMHASGCPGSHVVIRTHDANPDSNVLQDAAALAARQSKCGGAVIKVSLCRCRDVSKPRGAKAGLVQLSGQVRTLSVNMKEAEKRLKRLDATEEIN